MSQGIYCEPYCIEQGYEFEIHHVEFADNEAYDCATHFHEVHEFIIFEKIEGSYFYSQGESSLKDSDIVFTPAAETHNFECTARGKSWFIVQFKPHVLETKNMSNVRAFFDHGLHLRLPARRINEIQQQVKWLYESYHHDPLSPRSITLLNLLICTIAEYATSVEASQSQPITRSPLYEKMLPVINQFKNSTAVELSVTEAAEACHLSPSHFSRMFKHIFRVNYSEYTMKHKLYSAARLLSQSGLSVTQISYELNFSSPSHFISQFKKHFSVTPRQYRTSFSSKAW
ncbi:helix-turn-helix domain-containing protein [Alteromonas stellipolaris]|uniref:helix-turn-helix domain-containing protein n=1 Tax=Alteromonas stellipolaris TaxID=233316 RepID=UPI00273612B0|nr:AraC family transcriptional regulator [Alteromonas stellipolaris]MDP2595407.1 AraC family transcriptional regulator [Alteromonas stellipolaris]